MNNKGFSLVELLATIVILAIVTGITVSVINFDFGKAKKNTEEVFVDTIKDAMDVYLSSDAKKLNFNTECFELLDKTHGNVKVYMTKVTFKSVIDSEYHPIAQSDLINPANEDVACANAANITVNIYKDEDQVYYYSIAKSSFNCLLNVDNSLGYESVISNLPGSEFADAESGEKYIIYKDLGENCR